MSWQNSVLTRAVLPLAAKRRVSSAERVRRDTEKHLIRPERYAPPKHLDRRTSVTARRHDGWPVYEIAPRKGVPKRTILYLHGGAYVLEISSTHWRFISRLADRAGARVTVPIYPLGPVLGPHKTVTALTDIATDLIERHGADQVVLMGDSAGGGLALAVAQALRDAGHSVARLVLIAPWVDATVSHPDQPVIAKGDAMLTIAGLAEAARIYAGDVGLDHRLVSPVNGDMTGLPPTCIVTGTDDLLLPDSQRLREACTVAGTPCELVEGPGMQHVYPLLPIPEAKAALDLIVARIGADADRFTAPSRNVVELEHTGA